MSIALTDPEAQKATIRAFWTISVVVQIQVFSHPRQVYSESLWNSSQAFENELTSLKQRCVRTCGPHDSKRASVLAGGMDRISFRAFTWEGKITENLQFSLSVLRVDRKGENKMVLIVLEENLGFREMIPLRENWGGKMKGDPPACQQSCGAVPGGHSFSHPHKVQTQQRALPAHPSPRPSVPHVVWACAGCLAAPGMESER